jgi:hypothetical protein
MTCLRNEIAYPLVVVWSLIGIAVARSAIPLLAFVAVAAALAVLAVIGATRPWQHASTA